MDQAAGYLVFSILGYLSGSVLYAWLLPKIFCKIDIRELSDDHNPGAFNAFHFAGKKVGVCVILLELLKAMIPVYVAGCFLDRNNLLFALVIAAPVIGHAFPIFHLKDGGKAIAASFGSLLGLIPDMRPVLFLCGFYLLFSLIVVIKSHLKRSIVTYVCFLIAGLFSFKKRAYILGSMIISVVVVSKHLMARRL